MSKTPCLRDIIDYFNSIPDNICGGSLHIVFADGNYKNSDLSFCFERALERKDYLAAFLAQELLKIPEDKLEDVLLYGVPAECFTDK